MKESRLIVGPMIELYVRIVAEELTSKLLEAGFEVADELGHPLVKRAFAKALAVTFGQERLSVEIAGTLQVLSCLSCASCFLFLFL